MIHPKLKAAISHNEISIDEQRMLADWINLKKELWSGGLNEEDYEKFDDLNDWLKDEFLQ